MAGAVLKFKCKNSCTELLVCSHAPCKNRGNKKILNTNKDTITIMCIPLPEYVYVGRVYP